MSNYYTSLNLPNNTSTISHPHHTKRSLPYRGHTICSTRNNRGPSTSTETSMPSYIKVSHRSLPNQMNKALSTVQPYKHSLGPNKSVHPLPPITSMDYKNSTLFSTSHTVDCNPTRHSKHTPHNIPHVSKSHIPNHGFDTNIKSITMYTNYSTNKNIHRLWGAVFKRNIFHTSFLYKQYNLHYKINFYWYRNYLHVCESSKIWKWLPFQRNGLKDPIQENIDV